MYSITLEELIKEAFQKTKISELNPDKTQKQQDCYNKFHWALEKGDIKKPKTCDKCGKKGKVEAHHTNYDKPMQVTWVCSSCHKKLKG